MFNKRGGLQKCSLCTRCMSEKITLVKITIVSSGPLEGHLLSRSSSRDVDLESQEDVVASDHVQVDSRYKTLLHHTNAHQQDNDWNVSR